MRKIRKGEKRILVIRPDRVGDVVLATPLIQTLRKHFPDSYIVAMVRPHTAVLLDHNPHLNAVILDDFEVKDKGWKGFLRKVREIRMHRFDTALMLLPTQRVAWMLFFSGILHRIGVGKKLYETFTFTRTVSRNNYIPLRHEADYCMDLGRKIGVKHEDLTPQIFLTRDEKNDGMAILKNKGISPDQIIVGINPGSGNSAPNWSWTIYSQLAKLITHDSEIALVLTGNSDEKPLCDLINRNIQGRAFNLAGQSLKELITVITHFHVLVSSSTGPMHIAAALKVPTVSIFCPLPARSPVLWGPLGNEHTIFIPKDDFCMNCDKKTKCNLASIDVRQIYQAIHVLIKKNI